MTPLSGDKFLCVVYYLLVSRSVPSLELDEDTCFKDIDECPNLERGHVLANVYQHTIFEACTSYHCRVM